MRVLHHLNQTLANVAAQLMTYGCSSTTDPDRITQFVVTNWRKEFIAGRMSTCKDRVLNCESAKQDVLSLYADAGVLCECISAVKKVGAALALPKLMTMNQARKTHLQLNRWGGHFLAAARAWRQCGRRSLSGQE